MKTRFSESEAEEPNQAWEPALRLVNPSASVATSDSDNLVFTDHKRNVSEGVVSGVGRNGNVLILLTPMMIMIPLTTPIFDFH